MISLINRRTLPPTRPAERAGGTTFDLLRLAPSREGAISRTCKIKVYPNGDMAAVACNSPIFREPGWELRKSEVALHFGETEVQSDPPRILEGLQTVPDPTPQANPANLERSRRRALTAVRDYALSNDFKYFVTLTLDKERIDRYDYAKIIAAMRIWCDNQVRRKGLYYVLVPELHKDGALHFHGFFPAGVEVVDSGTVIPPEGGRPRKPRSKKQRAEWLAAGGHIVYNLPDWGFGWSTAIELYGRQTAAVAYVCKYISKAEGKVGGRWYYHGGKLKRPDIVYTDATPEDLLKAGTDTKTGETTARLYTVPAIGLQLCYFYLDMGRCYGDNHNGATGRNRAGAGAGGPERVGPGGQVGACQPPPGGLENQPVRRTGGRGSACTDAGHIGGDEGCEQLTLEGLGYGLA